MKYVALVLLLVVLVTLLVATVGCKGEDPGANSPEAKAADAAAQQKCAGFQPPAERPGGGTGPPPGKQLPAWKTGAGGAAGGTGQ
ncbi:MAG TPA: hypothetical protein PLD23_21005 [Armatimonadota bacterium]|nr:hypothetical protein [Armatimonadota bacterium]HQK95988.1 hypothetical protein [Armatimonadota bacterium]